MSQYDGYVRISTENDTSSAKRSTEELGDTIHDAMDTTPVDKMTSAMDNLNSSANGADTSGLNDMRDGVDKIGDSAISTGDLIRANLISDTVMSGLKQIAGALKDAGVESIRTAMSNETAFAKASTLLKGDDLEKYFEGLIDISNRTGVAFADLAESMYSALSAGVPQDNVLSFVENTVNLSKGGFTQTATAIDIVTTALNAYQMEMTEATHVQDVLITTQNLGKTTVDELASNMGKLIPTANGVNVAFDQLGAMYATVTANGVATAETTTYLNSMINELGASGSTAEKAMMEATKGTDMAGKKFSEISAMGYDVTDVLSLMDDYAQSTGKSLSDMFSSSEGAKAASILLSNMESYKENIVAMEQSAGAASTAAETMMDTTAEKVQVAKNQIDNLVNTIAESLLPVIGETAQEVSDAASAGDLKETAEQIGDFAAGTLSFLLKNIKLIGAAVAGVTTGVVAFKAASKITDIVIKWQEAALQVTLLGNAEGTAAIKAAALNGTLTTQEIIYGVLSGKLDVATAKTALLNTAMLANPAGAIAAVIGVLAAALSGYAMTVGSAESASRKLNDAIKQMNEQIEDSIDDNNAEMAVLKDKAARYEELRSAVSLTADEHQELALLAQELQDTLGDEVSVVNKLTGEYNDLSGAVDTYIRKRSAAVKLAAYEDAAKEAYRIKAEAEKTIAEYLKYSDDGNWDFGAAANLLGSKNWLGLFQGNLDMQAAVEALSEANDTIAEWQALLSESYQNGITSSGDTLKSDFVLGSKYIAAEEAKKGQKEQKESAEELAELYKQQRADAKYSYDMGVIDAQDYYAKLAVMRDKYLEVDSDEWRSVNVEIKKYTDELTASQKKAYDEAVKAQEQAAKEADIARFDEATGAVTLIPSNDDNMEVNENED